MRRGPTVRGMTTVLVALGVLAAIFAGVYGYVAWRGRGRLPAGDDRAAGRDARARQQRFEAERHGSQGDLWKHPDQGSGW